MMNFPLLFPSLMIFVHLFWRVSCDIEFKKLHRAIARDNIRLVKKFLEDENRQRVLHETLMKAGEKWERSMEVMGSLRLDSRLRLPGNGALHWAVINVAPKVTRLLLENGADVNMLNFQGLTPLSLAAEMRNRFSYRFAEKYAEVINTLLDFRPDVSIGDDFDLLPLCRAVNRRNLLFVQKLLERGGNINERCQVMEITSLHIAVDKGYVEMTKFLLSNGADAGVRNRHGKNVLHIIFNAMYYFRISLRSGGTEDFIAIANLLLKLENAENMLKQREYLDLKTPVDMFFEQEDPNRVIMVDLLKILPSMEDAYAENALRTFSPSLEQHSTTWPMDDFPEYVKIAFNSYLEILSKDKPEEPFDLNASPECFSRDTGVKSISPTYDIKYFIENGYLYFLYVILQAHFRIRRRQDRYDKAAEEVKKFDEYLHELSVPFQNALWNAIAKGTTLENLPAEILTKIFQRWRYGPYIDRMSKIMALVQFSGTQRWSVEEIVDAAPAFRNT